MIQTKADKKPKKVEQRVYPLRVQQRLNYMDVEVPDDDDFICKWYIHVVHGFVVVQTELEKNPVK